MRTEASKANRPIVAAMKAWWQRVARGLQARRELAQMTDVDVARLASDVGVSGGDLRALAAHGPEDAELLYRRMATLQIDRNELGRTDPAVLRDLQRVCTLCQARGRCMHDLAHEFADPAWQEWREYCPNATTLTVLSTVRTASGAVGAQ